MGEIHHISIKGLEGSTDLPISRPCIIGNVQKNNLERIILHPNHFKCSGTDLKWSNINQWQTDALAALENKGPLQTALRWNAGVYLWLGKTTNSLQDGLKKAEDLMATGIAKTMLKQLINWRANINS